MTSRAMPPQPPVAEPPKLLRDGRYALLRKLGEGSQGQTYEAMDHGVGPEARARAARAAPLADQWSRYVRAQKSGGEVPQDARLVAIKCFRVGTAKSWKDVELAEREATTLKSLEHAKLPRYFEHFEEDGALYLVMEKIEGESLASLRAQKRTMSVAEVTRMLEDIADALRYLHGRAPYVVHRDIKPGNVIRRPDGSFALVDFGAVRDRLKPAGGSTVVGTFGYMAPEQFQGRASPRSDVYGLGATAITMLTGVDPEELPHAGLGIDVAKALPAGTPPSLLRTLTAMLVPDPDARVGSVDEALGVLHAREAPPPPPSPLPTGKPSGATTAPERARNDRRALAMMGFVIAWLGVYGLTQRWTDGGPFASLAAVGAITAVTFLVLGARRARASSKGRSPAGVAGPKVRVAEPRPLAPVRVVDADSEALDDDDASVEPRAERRRRRR